MLKIYAQFQETEMDEKLKIFLLFANHTNNQELLQQIINRFEKVKSSYLFYFHKLTQFGQRFTDGIFTKKL